MPRLLNAVRVNCSTTGTGTTLAIGSAVSTAYQTPGAAGAVAGDVYTITIDDGALREITVGTVGAGATSIDRAATPIWSSTGARLNLSGSAIISFGPAADDIVTGEFAFPTKRVTGQTYPLYHPSDSYSNGAAFVANQLILRPFTVGSAVKFDQLMVNVLTAGAAGTLGRAGIYASNDSGYPTGAPLFEVGPFSVATTGIVATAISGSLPPGMYWDACVSDGTPAFASRSNNNLLRRIAGSPTALIALGSSTDLAIAHTFGPLPTLALSGALNFSYTTRAATIAFRAA